MKPFLVADLFCGAGGTSTGAVRAVREMGREIILVCINHWPVAIETHKKNHPEARHYIADLSIADPVKIVTEGYLDLLCASPECTGFSRARGGKPTNDQTRMNPWAVINWLTRLDVRCLLVENVPEFIHWGPLLPNGKPDPKKRGLYFQAWFNAIRDLGYRPEWKYLNAADYGDATTRVRFFMIARKDGNPIRWPTATHSPDGYLDMLGQLPRWKAAREIINWDNPGRSLLDDPKYKKRPLAKNTMRRIARGLEKFGGPLAPYFIKLLDLEPMGQKVTECHSPFVMGKQSHPAYRSVDEPMQTITADGRPMLIEPVVEPFIIQNRIRADGDRVYDINKPLKTITSHGAGALVEPCMIKYYGSNDASSVDMPLPTVTTKDRFGLVRPVLVEVNHDGGDRATSVDRPLKTITKKRGTAIISPFIVEWDNYNANGDLVWSSDRPMPTIVTKANKGILMPVIEAVASGAVDPRRVILIDGVPYLLDLRFRMISNPELAAAMSFTKDEFTYEFVGSGENVTRQIGNAVPCETAKALIRAILEVK